MEGFLGPADPATTVDNSQEDQLHGPSMIHLASSALYENYMVVERRIVLHTDTWSQAPKY